MEDRGSFFERLKTQARALKQETYAIHIAARDPRTPWYAKALIWSVVVYAFSPIDLIPDFIPVLGYLDDLILIPAGIALAVRLIPPEALAQARETAKQAEGPGRSVGWIGAGVILLIWAAILTWGVQFIVSLYNLRK